MPGVGKGSWNSLRAPHRSSSGLSLSGRRFAIGHSVPNAAQGVAHRQPALVGEASAMSASSVAHQGAGAADAPPSTVSRSTAYGSQPPTVAPAASASPPHLLTTLPTRGWERSSPRPPTRATHKPVSGASPGRATTIGPTSLRPQVRRLHPGSPGVSNTTMFLRGSEHQKKPAVESE